MIIVTVGMQLGFDRLITAMDDLAPDLAMAVVAQTGLGAYRPRNMEAQPMFAPEEFEALADKAQLIVSHAGIGTVLTAARCHKPILLMPRRADMGEHRNDHQLATVRKLAGRPGILVARDERELAPRIAEGLTLSDWSAQPSATAHRLHQALAAFIENRPL